MLTFRLGVKRGINLCVFLLSLSDQLFLLSKTSAKLSKVVLKLSQGEEGAGRWDYAVVSYHLIRKASNRPGNTRAHSKHAYVCMYVCTPNIR